MAASFKFMEICIEKLSNFFSDGSYIAEPARCQSRERLLKIGLCFSRLGRCGTTGTIETPSSIQRFERSEAIERLEHFEPASFLF